MQSLDPVHLARAIGTNYAFWPLDYDLTGTQWREREADAAGIEHIRRNTLFGVRPAKSAIISPVVSYSRDLIRLAFLPKTLRTQVLEEVVRIVKIDVDRGALPTPRGWRRSRRGRAPVYQWHRPKRRKGAAAWEGKPTVPQRFQFITHLHVHGYRTAEIVQAARDRFGMQWPGQHETYDALPEKERKVRLRKLHKDTVLRDVRKARRERARMAEQKR